MKIGFVEFEASSATAILEASATAVGVGMVLGGFAAGLVGLIDGWDRGRLDFQILRLGYGGAAICLALRLIDIAII